MTTVDLDFQLLHDCSSTSSRSSSSTSSKKQQPRLSRLSPQCLPDQIEVSKHYFAVRKGHRQGVFTHWQEAENQVLGHPDPVYKTFSTRLAAEAFVTGWDGGGRYSLPPSSPQPLREYLAMNFPSSVPLSAPSKPRSHHSKPLCTLPSLPSVAESSTMTDFAIPPLDRCRPSLTHSSSSYRKSMVRISSPLRQEVDDEVNDSRSRPRVTSVMGFGGLISPPHSPESKSGQTSVMNRERPVKPRTVENPGLWGSAIHRDPSIITELGLLSPPNSPPLSGSMKRRSPNPGYQRSNSAPAGLWGDLPSPPTTPVLPDMPDFPKIPDSAPKFSRSALKRSSVVMPVPARRPSSSSSNSSRSIPSLKSRSSFSNLFGSSSSSVNSVTSISSQGSDADSVKTMRRTTSGITLRSGQDRLNSLAETSKAELQLNDAGLLALSALSPPRPAFMRSPSSSSVSSEESGSIHSLSSFTSAASTLETLPSSVHHEAILEVEENEAAIEVVISCTKSDGDAEGSVESSSMKSGKAVGGKTKKSGMFKRFSKALGMEKKVVPGSEGRRGSL